jgi:hypothetical protein
MEGNLCRKNSGYVLRTAMVLLFHSKDAGDNDDTLRSAIKCCEKDIEPILRHSGFNLKTVEDEGDVLDPLYHIPPVIPTSTKL